MSALLIKLALQAYEDESALPVLGDAVLETGWVDRRVGDVCNQDTRYLTARAARALHLELAAKPTMAWARACAAVLLFGQWKKGFWTWPGVRAPRAVATTQNMYLRQLYPDGALQAYLDEPSPFYGLGAWLPSSPTSPEMFLGINRVRAEKKP